MKRIGIVLGVIAVLGLGLYLARGPIFFFVLSRMGPSTSFDPAQQGPAPDYASAEAWLARPETQDLTDYVPAQIDRALAQSDPAQLPGVAADAADAAKPVDVFFVHPTTYLRGEGWTDPLRTGTSTEENTRWVMVNQASAYNGCCNVYAPRYRQTSVYAFFQQDNAETGKAALDFAYQDVARAFDHFVSQISQGRPFILAGHSQGTIHLRRLLRERISGTPLAQRMVAAYLIGGGVNLQELAAMPDLHACRSATDLGCVVHWATYGPGARAVDFEPGTTTLCTNPLTWTVNEEPAPASANLGAVVPSGSFNVAFWGEDRAEGVQFQPLAAPLTAHTGAQCQDGALIADDQAGSPFAMYAGPDADNYHGLDYALFYMNIRENARARVNAYLAAAAAPAASSGE